MKLREQLIEARPNATAYAESLRALPSTVEGIRGYIGALKIFPIKALCGISLNNGATVGNRGLSTPDGMLSDRMAMLALREPGEIGGEGYDFVRFSQRNEGKLVLPIGSYNERNNLLTYSAGGIPMLPVDISPDELAPREGKIVRVKMFNDGEIFEGIPEEGSITEWVRNFLAKQEGERKYRIDDIELLLPSTSFERTVEDRHRREQEAGTIYSDGGQILAASSSTLSWMNRGLKAHHQTQFRPIEMDAFRPNMILGGLPHNAEDIIDEIQIMTARGPIRMLFGGMSVRCPVTQINQVTGEKLDKEPLNWLSKNRPPRLDKPNSATFGINTVFPREAEGSTILPNSDFVVTKEKEA